MYWRLWVHCVLLICQKLETETSGIKCIIFFHYPVCFNQNEHIKPPSLSFHLHASSYFQYDLEILFLLVSFDKSKANKNDKSAKQK